MKKSQTTDELCVNTLRFLAIDGVQKANSGHPGMPMGAAPMAHVLWNRFLKFNPKNPDWFDRDRFVLSAGHGSMLLYALLHVTGYAVSLDDLKNFRQWGSITPGHPERNETPGVEVTTGPLGQGFANGVGMAVAEKHLAARYNQPGHEIINHYTYGICGDGDIMEGVCAEAAAFAGHLKLDKLIYLYDYNRISLAGAIDMSHTEDVGKRFEAYGWQVLQVENGNDLNEIEMALRAAKKESEKPTLIIVHTHIGFGSPKFQDTSEAHGSPLGADEVKKTKENLGWPLEPDFYIPDEALKHFREAVEQGATAEKEWNKRFDRYRDEYPEQAIELKQMIIGDLPDDWAADIPVFKPEDGKIATRSASGKILNAIAPHLPALFGGSADLSPSTKTLLKGLGDFEPPEFESGDSQGSAGGGWSYSGRNIRFGVREHAMGAIANGMAAHGAILPYTGTFLIFSDYMKPALRLASLMKLPVKYVFTHDSIALGEDGPTHQAVEQMAGMRAIPGFIVIRPADANETAEAWKVAIEIKDQPVALALSRQNLPVFDRSKYGSAEGLRRGAYILTDAPDKHPDLILIATGSEVALAIEAADKISTDNGISVRIVSMPSWELFEQQSPEYQQSVLPDSPVPRLAIEAGSPMGWHKWVGSRGDIIGVEKFGSSAPGERVLHEYGFHVESVIGRARTLLSRRELA